MTSKKSSEWPEHALCARCGVPLADDYRETSLGLRFCAECYAERIQEKERERSSEIYLKGRCSQCGGSLINGYETSKLGVIYCLPCFRRLRKA
jgi:formylmethanofuran dehydrogenase subunit E